MRVRFGVWVVALLILAVAVVLLSSDPPAEPLENLSAVAPEISGGERGHGAPVRVPIRVASPAALEDEPRRQVGEAVPHPVLGRLSPEQIAKLTPFGRFMLERPDLDPGLALHHFTIHELSSPEGRDRFDAALTIADQRAATLEEIEQEFCRETGAVLQDSTRAALRGHWSDHQTLLRNTALDSRMLQSKAIITAISQGRFAVVRTGSDRAGDMARVTAVHGEPGPNLHLAEVSGKSPQSIRVVALTSLSSPAYFAAERAQERISATVRSELRAIMKRQ